MQRDDGLARAGPALHDEHAGQLGADDLVLLALDGGDDVGEAAGAGGLEGGDERAVAGDAAARRRAASCRCRARRPPRRTARPRCRAACGRGWRSGGGGRGPSARARWPGRRARRPAPASRRRPAPGPRRRRRAARCRRSSPPSGRRRRRAVAGGSRSMRPNTSAASPRSSCAQAVTMVSQMTSRSKRACSVPPRPTSTIVLEPGGAGAGPLEAVVGVVDVRLLGLEIGMSGHWRGSSVPWQGNGSCYRRGTTTGRLDARHGRHRDPPAGRCSLEPVVAVRAVGGAAPAIVDDASQPSTPTSSASRRCGSTPSVNEAGRAGRRALGSEHAYATGSTSTASGSATPSCPGGRSRTTTCSPLPAPDDADELRTCVRADIDGPRGPLQVFSTHLNWRFDQIRVRQEQVRGDRRVRRTSSPPRTYPADPVRRHERRARQRRDPDADRAGGGAGAEARVPRRLGGCARREAGRASRGRTTTRSPCRTSNPTAGSTTSSSAGPRRTAAGHVLRAEVVGVEAVDGIVAERPLRRPRRTAL